MLDVRNVLNDARQFPRHHVDVRNFIVPSRHVQCSDSEAQISGLFIYLLNELAKIVIRQFAGDARVDPAKAEPVGLLLMMNFGFATFQWKGTPYLIDIFLAKYHKVCPALFGIYDAVPKGGTIDYAEYITGLAGGFASVTLRDFSKAQGKNPLPCSIFWKTVAMIINTPPAQVQNTHLFVLKALLHPVYVEKFIRFYGDMGISLLRRATVEFPADLDSNAATGVKVLPDQWRKEIKLIVR